MSRPLDSWSMELLPEFLASVFPDTDAPTLITSALDSVAAAFDAEVAAVTAGGQVQASIGYPRNRIPEAELLDVAKRHGGTLQVEGVGQCEAVAVAIEGPEPGWLLVARDAEDSISPEEHHLLRGMARALSLSLKSARLVTSLRDRQALLERLSLLRHSITGRVELHEVLDSIVAAAADLVGDEVVALRLICESDSTQLEIVSATGIPDPVLASTRRVPITAGLSGRAIGEGHLIVAENYPDSPEAIPEHVAHRVRAAMSAPVYERGEIAGSLTVGTRREGREYTASEREALNALAEHASLALNDAHAVAETVHQAFHDSLTGLPNRALFLDRLEHALAKSGRNESPAAVLFVDIDGFKTVNDSLGHAAGDELLVMLAERIQQALRVGDTAARFGGDEFAILLDDTSQPMVPVRTAERLLEALAAPLDVRGHEVQLSASIGIAAGRASTDDMLRNADLAMYRAKRQGKGRYEIFEPGMHAAAVSRLEFQVDLKRAIEHEEFVLHYQPIVRLTTGAVVGVEALVRWRHPQRGLLAPAEFISRAEESRQIVGLGRWVLREACRQAALWHAQDPPDGMLPEVSVNLSGVQLEQPDLVGEVRAVLERSSLPPDSLILEITETALMADTQANVKTLEALKEIGVKLAVDDFGTGYSSLEYLQRFPIDILKIAKSFVDGLESASGDGALTRAIVDLAAGFELTVVAEGIEHAEQRDRLVQMGCELGQGFYFAYPTEPQLGRLVGVDGFGPSAGQFFTRAPDAPAAERRP